MPNIIAITGSERFHIAASDLLIVAKCAGYALISGLATLLANVLSDPATITQLQTWAAAGVVWLAPVAINFLHKVASDTRQKVPVNS